MCAVNQERKNVIYLYGLTNFILIKVVLVVVAGLEIMEEGQVDPVVHPTRGVQDKGEV